MRAAPIRGCGADTLAGLGPGQFDKLVWLGLADGVGLGVGDESALSVALGDATGEAVGRATAPGWPPQAVSKRNPRIGPAVRDCSNRILYITQLSHTGFGYWVGALRLITGWKLGARKRDELRLLTPIREGLLDAAQRLGDPVAIGQNREQIETLIPPN